MKAPLLGSTLFRYSTRVIVLQSLCIDFGEFTVFVE